MESRKVKSRDGLPIATSLMRAGITSGVIFPRTTQLFARTEII